MKTAALILLGVAWGACRYSARAQDTAPPATNPPPGTIASTPRPLPPAPAKTNDLYHLNAAFEYRHPWNSDYNGWTLGTIFFGKRLNERNSLDAGVGGGVIQLKPGGAADVQAHQPVFVQVGAAWRCCLVAGEPPCNPYVTVGANLLWMTWEYRNPVHTTDFGNITRDYLDGIDGYGGLGLKLRLWKRLDGFAEFDVGGTGFNPNTYFGVHNHLFANFGYVGGRAGLGLTF